MTAILASSQQIEPAISVFWLIPFAAMLGAIAVAPFIHKEWWEKRYPMVALALAIIASSYYLFGAGHAHRWFEGMSDYVSFIILLASLYTISGGIVIEISRKATPLANCTLLLIGAVLANLFGTTGAAMLLIRPYLRMNRKHLRPYHIVFFIFIVANVGGALTPMGDPPLFLGYLMGVPFWWTVEEMRTLWLVAVTLLLAIFFVIDTLDHRREERPHNHGGGPQVRILGIHNFIFILMVLFAIFQKGIFDIIAQIAHHGPSLSLLVSLLFSREVLMIVAAVASYLLTPDPVHERNEFHFGPIREVAILFAGIFATMIPAIQVMQSNADRIPLRTPGHFYFASGVLSSVLDNTPTYKTLLDTRLGALDPESVRLATDQLHKMAQARTLDIPEDLKGPVRSARSRASSATSRMPCSPAH